jgi:hypothetical protein
MWGGDYKTKKIQIGFPQIGKFFLKPQGTTLTSLELVDINANFH